VVVELGAQVLVPDLDADVGADEFVADSRGANMFYFYFGNLARGRLAADGGQEGKEQEQPAKAERWRFHRRSVSWARLRRLLWLRSQIEYRASGTLILRRRSGRCVAWQSTDSPARLLLQRCRRLPRHHRRTW